MMRVLDYQTRVLLTVDKYLDELVAAKERADQIDELSRQNPHLNLNIPDYAADAWKAMQDAGVVPAANTYSPRHDKMGRPVPNTTLKVPTGGGKTYLAIESLSKIMGRYLGQNHGFVLWIVPNEAIYSQTKKHLTNREHHYRQALDRAAAGRVRILEKSDTLDKRDVESNLCVMLLMLQSANRRSREHLKMFRDRGDVHRFFPPEGDQEAHQRLMLEIPNLDAYDASSESGSMWPLIKDSLGNALRMIRPVIVMDEGHKYTSNLAFDTLYGFNPCYVLELTATPARDGQNSRAARNANVIVEVTGADVDGEGMIKMPLSLDARQGTDWRSTLHVALERLNTLDRESRRFHANTGRYIRPIMLVQVERTGNDQRDGSHIHALDVKDWFRHAGLDDAEIAIKTADTNDLSQPENQDLLSPSNRVRVIITKQALQEGWDNPFAYILCSLAPSSDRTSMTQLVGRILRQPHAEKTGIAALDECYVVTHHAGTAEVIAAIKAGLEEGGLGDLVKEVVIEGDGAEGSIVRQLPRREAFRDTAIYLPMVLVRDESGLRPIDYDQDIIYQVSYADIDIGELVEKIPENYQAAENQMQRFTVSDNDQQPIMSEETGRGIEFTAFDPSYATRMVSDLVQNPWIAREIIGSLISGLHQRGFSQEQLGSISGLIVEEARKWLLAQQIKRAEALFRDKVASGEIQFRLRMDTPLNWSMPFFLPIAQPENARHLARKVDGKPIQKSLFAPVYEAEFNSDEREVAVYLDQDVALTWWHRNVARSQYFLQGWQREKIYPDFVFAVKKNDGSTRIAVLETKGDHLDNANTEYKRQIMQLMSQEFEWDRTVPAGELSLITDDNLEVVCEMVMISEWNSKLPTLLHPWTRDLVGNKEQLPS